MNTNTKQLPVIPHYVPTNDNTKMNDWAYCRRLYGVRHVRGLRPRVEFAGRNKGMDYGSLMHEGEEAYYIALKKERDPYKALFAAVQAIEAADYKDPIEDHRTKGRAVHDMKEYAKEYGSERGWDIYLTETAFNALEQDGFRYGGRIDLGVGDFEGLWPVDHKNISRFSDYYFDNYKLSPQMMGYVWGLKQLTDKIVNGVIMNVVVIHVKKTTFHRKKIYFSDAKLEQWKKRAIAVYHQIGALLFRDPKAEKVFDVSMWTPNFENCIGRYGPCPMFKICSGAPENYERKLAEYYEEGVWDWTDPDL